MSWQLFWNKNQSYGNAFPRENLVKFLKVTPNFTKNKNILDLGFGSLSNLKMAKALGFKTFGIDVSSKLIKKNSIAKLRLFNPPTIPFKNNYFGIIYSCQALYYNYDSMNVVIDQIYDKLVNGGKFFIDFRTKNHIWTKKHKIKIRPNIYKFKKNIPVKILSGLCTYVPETKKNLRYLFKKFNNVRVDTLKTNFLGREEEYYIVTGYKKPNNIKNLKEIRNYFEDYQRKILR